MAIRTSGGGSGGIRLSGGAGGLRVADPPPDWKFDFTPGGGAPGEGITTVVSASMGVYGPNVTGLTGTPGYWVTDDAFDSTNLVAGSSLRSHGFHGTTFYAGGDVYYLEVLAITGKGSTLEETPGPPTDRTQGLTSDDVTLWITAESLSDPVASPPDPWEGGLAGDTPGVLLVQVRHPSPGGPGSAVQNFLLATPAVKSSIDP